MKIKVKEAIAPKISSLIVPSPVPVFMTVVYMTMPMASLKMDSPKTMAYRFTSASISLKIANTETGSVALIKLPKANASFHVKGGDKGVSPTT